MTPAAGQGSLLLQIRDGDEAMMRALEAIIDEAALRELTTERTVVSLLGATCNSPLGVHAKVDAHLEGMRINAFVGLPDGSEWLRDSIEGDAAKPTLLGAELAKRLLDTGARKILDRAEKWSGRV
jgi:hydroxymethylbilane synthase